MRLLPSLLPYFLFFPSYGPHRDLHSFPTRRSSDLSTPIRNLLRCQSCPSKCGRRWTAPPALAWARLDRKSTRLNSSHRCISYAVFCLKKKKKQRKTSRSIILRQINQNRLHTYHTAY